MTVRPASVSHCEKIARVHLLAFPGFFLSSLGKNVLKEFYRALIQTPHCVVLIALAGDECVGFAAGSTRGGRLGRILLRRPRFLLVTLAAVACRPQLWTRVIRRRSRFQRPDNDPAAAVLWSIGVRKTSQGHGMGRALLEAFESRCRISGAPDIVLTTDLSGNERVLRFYESAGYEQVDKLREQQRELAVMKKHIPHDVTRPDRQLS
jgi:ribosomal protein S18 acetylase RimI-like enzyme